MAQANPSTSPSEQNPPTWLLPSNRKLRNIVSISLRNLSLIPHAQSRNRGKAADDEALPQTLQSPAKLVALREQKALGQSRSSTDLRAVAEDALVDSVTEETVERGGGTGSGSPVAGKQQQQQQQRDRPKSMGNGSPRRPDSLRPRRRSTLDWGNSTPQRRQERLEEATKERVADVFFSLHVQGIDGSSPASHRRILLLLLLIYSSTQSPYTSRKPSNTL